jgi:hypothetical protein
MLQAISIVHELRLSLSPELEAWLTNTFAPFLAQRISNALMQDPGRRVEQIARVANAPSAAFDDNGACGTLLLSKREAARLLSNSPESGLAQRELICKCLKRMAPQVGLEPTTLRLTVP